MTDIRNIGDKDVQDRYAADIGDYVKLALLRHLSDGRQLGIAWYLYPDEGHNADGKHTRYLEYPERWRDLDPELFDSLCMVANTDRSTLALQSSKILDATFFNEKLITADLPAAERSGWRSEWFRRLLENLKSADLVFADPDNGLVDDGPHRTRQKNFGKQMPVSEAMEFARGRTAIIYHHNSRFKGGHDMEVDHWSRRLGKGTISVRATAFNCRTFFIVNPDRVIVEKAKSFCERWAGHRVRFHEASFSQIPREFGG